MKSVREICDCYGCGVCAVVCSRHAVKLEQNAKGFYVPVVDDSLCNNCGLCIQVCAFAHSETVLKDASIKGFGAWSNDSEVRLKCSSGGIGFELGRYLLADGYKVCGVRYNASMQRAEHYIATDESSLIPSIGSKYIQSYTVDGFKEIDRTGKYLVTGTPCQIDSFRRYIRKFKMEDNFVLMDFFCHSVPSMLAWKKYLSIWEKKTGPVLHASWRNKFTGWHDSWAMSINGERGCHNSRLSQGDLFYKLFLGDYCCNPACQKDCKYKYDKSSADIRIGDFWGKTYLADEEGVSAVAVFTKKGEDIIQKLNCTLIKYPFSVVAEGQMKKNVGRHYLASIVSRWLSSQNTGLVLITMVFFVDWLCHLPKRIINRLWRISRR